MMRIFILILIILLVSTAVFARETQMQCSDYLQMVGMAVMQLPPEKSLQISCQISVNHCKKSISLSRQSIALQEKELR